jgi:hypothetical protein
MLWVVYGALVGFVVGVVVAEILGQKISWNLITPGYERWRPLLNGVVIFTTLLGAVLGYLFNLFILR